MKIVNQNTLILYHISPESIRDDIQKVPFEEYELSGLLSEFAYGQLVLMESRIEGRCLLLNKVDILGFVLEFEFQVKRAKSGLVAETRLDSMYQYYSLEIHVEGDHVYIKDLYTGRSIFFKVRQLLSFLSGYKKEVWKEFLLLYPELPKAKGFQKVQALFETT